jgi:hypothetical protein
VTPVPLIVSGALPARSRPHNAAGSRQSARDHVPSGAPRPRPRLTRASPARRSWLIAIAYWLAGGFIKSGLGNRIAYAIVAAFGKTTLGLTYSLVFAEALLSPAIPSVAARAGGIFFPLAKALCLACGSDPEKGTAKKVSRPAPPPCRPAAHQGAPRPRPPPAAPHQPGALRRRRAGGQALCPPWPGAQARRPRHPATPGLNPNPPRPRPPRSAPT